TKKQLLEEQLSKIKNLVGGAQHINQGSNGPVNDNWINAYNQKERHSQSKQQVDILAGGRMPLSDRSNEFYQNRIYPKETNPKCDDHLNEQFGKEHYSANMPK